MKNEKMKMFCKFGFNSEGTHFMTVGEKIFPSEMNDFFLQIFTNFCKTEFPYKKQIFHLRYKKCTLSSLFAVTYIGGGVCTFSGLKS